MRRYRNALVLLAFFVALLGVVLFTQNSKSNSTPVSAAATPTPNPNAAQLQLLNIPSTDAVTKLELKQADPAKTLAFKYENSKWLVDGPGGQELDTVAVASTVGQISTLKGTALITDKGDNLPNYGLDKPSLIITLTSPTAGARIINLGVQNQATKAYYVKLENDPRVVTISSTLVDQLKGWFDKLPVVPPTATPLPSIALSPLPSPLPTTTGSPAPTAGGTSPAPATPLPVASPSPTP